MRKFNPEKELRKIQHGNRNKIIFGVIALLIIIGISGSYALYQVRYTKRIIYTKVAPFSNHDINLAVYIDGSPSSNGDFPEKGKGKIYEKIDCGETKVKAYWDYDKWALVLETSKTAKCSVYFKTGTDTSGANPPELYQGLIPVTIDSSGTVKVANTSSEWYNYSKKQWANAVLVDSSKYATYNNKPNTTIPMEDILQMYVWIPRYKYQLFNVNNGGIIEQMINIIFEQGTSSTGDVSCEIDEKGKETCINALNGNRYTHPAFTFGSTQLTGIWVGKFETSHTTKSKGTATTDASAVLNCTTTDCSESDYIRIIPNVSSLRYNNTSNFFYVSRSIEKTTNKYNLNSSQIDTHMMKNMEWGAMAYLTRSKYGRCETDGVCVRETINTNASFLTGYDNTNSAWNTTNGQKASTTGNLYGVYDTSGGSWDNVMGVINKDATGTGILYLDSGFNEETMPNKKYYNLYEYGTSNTDHQRGHSGDATRETMKTFGYVYGAWYVTFGSFPINVQSWFSRGACALDGTYPSTYAFSRHSAAPSRFESFRVVITAQDGTE